MSDIFREVDEEVRQDKAKAMLKRYGGYVMGLAILIVVSVGGFKAWQFYSLQQLEKAGAEYLANVTLIDNDKDAEAMDAFHSLAQNGSSGFHLLSKFQEAGLLAKTGKASEATIIYDALADDKTLDESLRNLASFRAALLLSNTSTLKEVESRIGDLAKAGSPWRPSALEILAITAFRTGDLVRADQMFAELAIDPQTPRAMRTRVSAMMSIITPQLPATKPTSQETKTDAQ